MVLVRPRQGREESGGNLGHEPRPSSGSRSRRGRARTATGGLKREDAGWARHSPDGPRLLRGAHQPELGHDGGDVPVGVVRRRILSPSTSNSVTNGTLTCRPVAASSVPSGIRSVPVRAPEYSLLERDARRRPVRLGGAWRDLPRGWAAGASARGRPVDAVRRRAAVGDAGQRRAHEVRRARGRARERVFGAGARRHGGVRERRHARLRRRRESRSDRRARIIGRRGASSSKFETTGGA